MTSGEHLGMPGNRWSRSLLTKSRRRCSSSFRLIHLRLCSPSPYTFFKFRDWSCSRLLYPTQPAFTNNMAHLVHPVLMERLLFGIKIVEQGWRVSTSLSSFFSSSSILSRWTGNRPFAIPMHLRNFEPFLRTQRLTSTIICSFRRRLRLHFLYSV